MLITRTSPLTGKALTLELPITQAQLDELHSRPRRLLQDIFPTLTPAQHEFLLTGYTEADWAAIFPPESEEDQP